MLTAETIAHGAMLCLRAPAAGAGGAIAWTADDLIAWIEREFYIPEQIGKSDPPAMPLAEYQKLALREAMRRSPDGKFVFDLVLWSDIKKSAKSSIAAAVILFRALHTQYGSFKIVANDLKQADSRVFNYIKRALELNKPLGKRATIKNYHIALDTHSVIEALPVDPKGEAGGNDDLIEFTEVHAATSKAALAMWTEMTLSPTKRGYSQRWLDTYAGHSGEAPLLEPLYETIVKGGQPLDLGLPGLEVYANGGAFALWNTVPRCAWQTSADGQAYYASEARTLLPNEYRRIHQNEWTSSSDAFLPAMEWWAACRVSELPALDRYREVVVALDAAVSGDCFGIIAMSRTKDKVIPRYIRKWTPPKDGKLLYSDVNNPDNTDYPEGEIRRLCREYNVVCVGYDETQLHHLCTSLSNENLAYFKVFSQTNSRLKADKQFRDVIRERRIIHDGNTDLTEHIANANAKTEGDKLRIIKRANHLKIDLAVCASMATDLAFDLLPE